MSLTFVKVGASVVLLIGTAWAGTTWYSGHQIMQKYPEALTKMASDQSGMVKVVITRQTTGFLTSRVDWAAVITPNPCKPYEAFKVDGYDIIHNGVFPSLGMGQIETHIVVTEQIQPYVVKVFGTQEPLKITTNIGFSGDYVTSIESPAATYTDEQGQITWKGLNGKFIQTAGNSHSASQFTIEGLDVNAKAPEFAMKLGQMNLNSNSVKGMSGLGLGKGEFVLKTAEINADGKTYGLNDFKVSVDTSESNGFLAFSEKFQVAQLLKSGQSVGNMDIALSMEHLDALAVKNALDVLKKDQAVCQSDSGQAKASTDQFMQALKPILAKGFTAKLDHLNIETSDGKAHAAANVIVPSLNEAEVQDPKQALQKVNVDASANVSQSLLTTIASVAAKAKAQGQAIDSMQSDEMVDAMLVKPLTEGFVTKVTDTAGTRYSSTFNLRDGKMTLNDKTLN